MYVDMDCTSTTSIRYSALAVGGALDLADTDDDISRVLRLVVEEVVQDRLRPSGVTRLGVERGTCTSHQRNMPQAQPLSLSPE